MSLTPNPQRDLSLPPAQNQDSGFTDEGWDQWSRTANTPASAKDSRETWSEWGRSTNPSAKNSLKLRVKKLEAENTSLRYEVSRLGLDLSIVKSEKVALQKEIDRLHARIMMSQTRY